MKTNPPSDVTEHSRQSRLAAIAKILNALKAAKPTVSDEVLKELKESGRKFGQDEEPKIIIGAMKGEIEVPDDLDDPLPDDLLDAFEGKRRP